MAVGVGRKSGAAVAAVGVGAMVAGSGVGVDATVVGVSVGVGPIAAGNVVVVAGRACNVRVGVRVGVPVGVMEAGGMVRVGAIVSGRGVGATATEVAAWNRSSVADGGSSPQATS